MKFRVLIPLLMVNCSVANAATHTPQNCSAWQLEQLLSESNAKVVASACKALPNHKDTILASAIYHLPQDEASSYVWQVMLLDAQSHNIIGQYQDFLDEDATTRIDSDVIWLDTAAYQLADNNRAFGVRLAIGYWPQYAQGGSDKFLTLFSEQPQEGKLMPLVQSLPLFFWTEISAANDYSERTSAKTNGYVQVLPSTSHGLHDLQLVYPENIEHWQESSGDIHTQKGRSYKTILKYDGNQYPLGEWDNIPGKTWYHRDQSPTQ